MTPISILLLALAMSTDAFAAAIAKGAALHRPDWREAVRAGLIFGTIEGITPVVGWAAGSVAARHVTEWDHWIAFTVLGLLGARMVRAGLTSSDAAPEDRPDRHSFWVLATTGFATSIDAMAVGASLAFIDVAIAPVAVTIGLATCTAVTIGVLLGRGLGAVAGRWAEVIGGLALIGIGSTILYQHLHAT